MDKKQLLGKVFISHSSKDNEFVRKFTKELEKQGYNIWLDERELIAGDYLTTRIGKAIETSKVSIIILSKHSVNSKWVQYEINNAMECKIKGQMRLIPVLIEEVVLPPELTGLIFVDFRESFEEGVSKIIKALDYEADIYYSRRLSEHIFFGGSIENALVEVFGSVHKGGACSEYKSLDYNWVKINGFEILYEIVSYYGRPLSIHWWNEFSEVILDWGILRFHMVISERPVGFELENSIILDDSKIGANSKVIYTHLSSLYYNIEDLDVLIIDFSQVTNQKEYLQTLKFAEDYFKKLLYSD